MSNILYNIKIGTRLNLGFSLILLLMIALTVLGIGRVGEISRTLNQISDVNNIKSRYAINFRGSVHDRAIALRDVVLITDNAEAERRVTDIKRLAGNYADSAQKLDRMFAERTDITAQEQATLVRIKSSEATTMPLIENVIQLRFAGNGTEAQHVLLADARPAFVEWLRTVNQMIDLEEEMSQKDAARAREIAQSFHLRMLALCVTAMVVGLFIAWGIRRSILRPINDAASLVKGVAGGDLSTQVRTSTQDEIGALLHMLNTMTTSLVTMVVRVREAANGTGAASRQIASGNTDLSARFEKQAASLEETASSMTQLTETVKQNSDNARQANTLAVNATTIADHGDDAVRAMVMTIGKISDSSSKISDITGLIEGIAFQTNILALNAAVEAARAGEQGRGFAVVASEVRSLAQRSAAAAKEIKGLIESSVEVIQDGSTQASEVSDTMGRVKQAIKQVSDIVGEIAAASVEQSHGIEQINQAVHHMDEITQQNAVLVEQAAAAAQSLEEQSTDLKNAVAVFKIEGSATAS